MKKYLFAIALFTAHMAAVSQTVNIHFKNGTQIQYPSIKIDYVDFSANPSTPALTPGQVVDLGLSVYWASSNVGANTPESYGNYYSWGETNSHSYYNTTNYSFYDKNKQEYINIGQIISGTEYDAATVNLGSDWRIPTKEEMEELINKCTWVWGNIGDIYGYTVTGKNGNSIFLPASWSKSGGFITYLDSYVFLWTATHSNQTGEGEKAYGLEAGEVPPRIYPKLRYVGCPIRPVTSNPNASK